MPLVDELKSYIQQPDSYIKMTLIEKYNLTDIILTYNPYASINVITENPHSILQKHSKSTKVPQGWLYHLIPVDFVR